MPTLLEVRPPAALPLAEIEVHGEDLGPELAAEVSGVAALVTLARANRAMLRVPEACCRESLW